MLKLMNKKQKTTNNKGFSLVELIVVIAIMAVLVAVLAPAMLKYVENSRKSSDATAVAGVVSVLQASVISDNVAAGTYTVTITNTGCSVGSDDNGKLAQALTDAYGSGYTTSVKTKSKAWGNATGVTITITVGNDGVNSVSYTPTTFSDYVNETTTATSAPTTTP